MRAALRALLVLACLLVFASTARAAEPAVGTASSWGGPGAATHDCVWPWTDCQTRAVRSLDTGLVIVVTPTMFCDCYVGRVGPDGETERLIDLDPAMVAALGLDPEAGLWDVEIWPVEGTSGLTLPDTSTVGQ